MKFATRFLIVCICVVISLISQINYGICSENVPVSSQFVQSVTIPNNQNQQQTTTPSTSVQQPVQATKQVQQVPQLPQQQKTPLAPVTQQPSRSAVTNQGFIPALMNMIKALFNVIILIIAMVGIIVLLRRIKAKSPASRSAKKPSTKKKDITEPENVSEAVSSFVRHKLKRSS